MTMIYVPASGPEDWRKLLADPEKHWRPGYSAQATAQAWQSANGLPTEIAAILGPGAELLLAIPEHKVPMPGRGRESQCDVFALARAGGRTIAVAVEGKVAEPFGPTIGEWLVAPTELKTFRISSICEMLGIDTPPAPSLRYQLFHRTAAAVIEARRFGTDAAAMVVHSFSPEHLWFDDFAAFCAMFGQPPTRGAPIVVKLPDHRQLILGWASGPAAMRN